MHTPRTAILFIALTNVFVAFVASCVASAADHEPQYIRVLSDGSSSVLQTSVRTYIHPARVRVTLINTVHLADATYFAELSQRLTAFDRVLVEGVARRRAVNAHTQGITLGMTQGVTKGITEGITKEMTRIANTFGLRQQVSTLKLPPTAEQADLSAEAFDAARSTISASAGAAAVASAIDHPSPAPTTRALFFAGVASIETDPRVLHASERAYAIRERNASVMDSLRAALARNEMNIALVYGAAHGSDLNRRLRALGFVCTKIEWINACEDNAR